MFYTPRTVSSSLISHTNAPINDTFPICLRAACVSVCGWVCVCVCKQAACLQCVRVCVCGWEWPRCRLTPFNVAAIHQWSVPLPVYIQSRLSLSLSLTAQSRSSSPSTAALASPPQATSHQGTVGLFFYPNDVHCMQLQGNRIMWQLCSACFFGSSHTLAQHSCPHFLP